MIKMNFPGKKPENQKSDLFVIPLSERELLPRSKSAAGPLLSMLMKQYGRALLGELKERNFHAKASEALFFDTLNHGQCKGILFLGLPATDSSQLQRGFAFQRMGFEISKAAKERRFSSVLLDCTPLQDDGGKDLEAILEGLYLASYKFEQYKSPSKEQARFKGIRELILFASGKSSSGISSRAAVINQGVELARDLCNMPSSDCTPSFLLKTARGLARSHRLALRAFGRAELEKMRAGALLSVARGSSQEPVLIRLSYKPVRKNKRTKKIIALVGKGITFDTGGICVKPSAGMEEMKLDMAGAAAVLGAMKVIALLKPSLEVRAYIPAAENMIDGRGTKPGDIVRSMNGKTIEVINTDAEGRLILADALALAEKEKCDEIIDLATLTGAAVVALGVDCAGLFTPHDDLALALLDAAEASREYLWRMPLIEEYKEQMKSRLADLKNIGDRSLGGGSITGALFLQEFIKSARWAHLDIAGPALRTAVGKEGAPGSSGYGVRTLVRYVLSTSRQKENSSV